MAEVARHRILIADDNRDAADTLAMILELAGFEARVAYDGQQAVAAALKFSPEAAILDINMPAMDGYQAARVIRASGFGDRIVLIALTARNSADDLRAAEAAGFDVHLTKPVDGEGLGQLLEQALSSVA